MIKVLIVDDSAVVRRMLAAELSRVGGIEVIGTARDAYDVRDKVLALRPDVLTLDVNMPKMDGLTFLAKLMKHYPMPVVVISAMTQAGSEQAVRRVELGAIDVAPKPAPPHTLADLTPVLVEKIPHGRPGPPAAPLGSAGRRDGVPPAGRHVRSLQRACWRSALPRAVRRPCASFCRACRPRRAAR